MATTNGIISEYAHASRTLVHLSDVHLRDHLPGYGTKLYDHIDSYERLKFALSKLMRMGVNPDALIFTGDLADLAEPGAYRDLKELVGEAAADLGADVIWVMGNHDDRELFREHLLEEGSGTSPADAVYDIDGVRVISLDSTVPGYHHGHIDQGQLEWLADVLAAPAKLGTILAMHHPPIPMINDATVAVELRGQVALAEALRGTDVRGILAGHLHYSTHATFAGIPVSVASATCYTQDLTVPKHSLQPSDGNQGFNLVHVYEDTIVHTIVPVNGGRTMQTVTREQVRAWMAADDIRIKGQSGPRS